MTEEVREPRPVSPGIKKALLAFLVACFAVQSFLVYTDEPSQVRLRGPALDGSRLWHEHGCQVCHQFYGFGGFLGPDLTNVASRYSGPQLHERLEHVLTRGSGQMPAFELGPGDVDALHAFLVEMDKTGIGEARAGVADSSNTAITERLEATGPTGASEGHAIVRARACLACHAPFGRAASGAPALAEVAGRLTSEELDERLRVGKPPNMPAPTPPFEDHERAEVAAFLVWLHEDRAAIEALAQRLTGETRIALSDLPWWEYE